MAPRETRDKWVTRAHPGPVVLLAPSVPWVLLVLGVSADGRVLLVLPD